MVPRVGGCAWRSCAPRKASKALPRKPHRWIIERTFAWLTQNRRLVRDYEEREINSEAMILIAMSKLMLKRLAKWHY